MSLNQRIDNDRKNKRRKSIESTRTLSKGPNASNEKFD